MIVGGDASLGVALRAAAATRASEVWVTSRRRAARVEPNAGSAFLDLRDRAACERFAFPEPLGRVYLLAAVTSLRACRESPAAARAVNVDAVGVLAERAAAAGGLPVLVSTNLVFDGGTPRVACSAPLRPRTVYGEHKAQAERLVLDAGGVVVRPTKVLPREPAMLADWRDALRDGKRVEAFTDLWFAPVPMPSVIDALLDAGPGVHHVSGRHDLSYYEAALHLAQRVEADPGLVVPAKAADAGIPPEERPRHTTLACGRPFAPWDVLDRALGFA